MYVGWMVNRCSSNDCFVFGCHCRELCAVLLKIDEEKSQNKKHEVKVLACLWTVDNDYLHAKLIRTAL